MKNSVNKEFIIKFGLNLRSIRERKNISMQVLADIVNIEYPQISRIGRGIINTPINTANDIAIAIEIDIRDLFNFS